MRFTHSCSIETQPQLGPEGFEPPPPGLKGRYAAFTPRPRDESFVSGRAFQPGRHGNHLQSRSGRRKFIFAIGRHAASFSVRVRITALLCKEVEAGSSSNVRAAVGFAVVAITVPHPRGEAALSSAKSQVAEDCPSRERGNPTPADGSAETVNPACFRPPGRQGAERPDHQQDDDSRAPE
jgi:hypothetical protein